MIAFGSTLELAPLHAAPRDRAARAKIAEALELYSKGKADDAESLLRKIVAACEDRCSPRVLAEAWMLVGIVRGGGHDDLGGARSAFRTSLALDPSVALDTDIATEETRRAWKEVASSDSSLKHQSQPNPQPAEPPPEPENSLECDLDVREVETRRRIPISCSTPERADRLELRYRPPSAGWKRLRLVRRRNTFVGEIPCSATFASGTLLMYAAARREGEIVDRWASKEQPIDVALVERSSEPPPALPGHEPPARCAEPPIICPPDFPGCPCEDDTSCGTTFVCRQGRCVDARRCARDDDCAGGSCESGTCQRNRTRRFFIGLGVAQDFALVSGSELCARSDGDARFACFDASGTPYSSDTEPGFGGSVHDGFLLSTTRVLGSFDIMLGRKFALGGRLGFAFRGAGSNADFFAPHLEARASYWPLSSPAVARGLLPFAFVTGGVAQVDARIPVVIRDCALGRLSDPPETRYSPTSTEYRECKSGTTVEPHRTRHLDAELELGRSFAGLGAGIVYSFGRVALRADTAALILFPSSGLALEPSFGVLWGF